MNGLIIGCGPHAKRIYIPMLKERKELDIVCVIDLETQKQVVEEYLKKVDIQSNTIFLSGRESEKDIKKLISVLKEKYSLDFVVIATEPLAHLKYARSCLKNNLSILMDKPITTRENVSTNLKQAKGILEDFNSIKKEYKKAIKRNPELVFELMAQRRYHKSFQFVKGLLDEIFQLTKCPVTSIQTFHGDGQWRLPDEIVSLNYHPYNQGYGKASHSGYHSIDMVIWLLENCYTTENKIDNFDITSFSVRPTDLILQIPIENYHNIFKSGLEGFFSQENTDYHKTVEKYGEVDCFSNVAFKRGDKTVTLASVNLVHNSFSQRGWPNIDGRDLYKGNGRVRHESYYILQGPFQAISIISYQSTEIMKQSRDKIGAVGGEFHFDIHVFRNDKLFPQLDNYKSYSILDTDINISEGRSRGHQEDARRKCIEVFLEKLNGNYTGNISSNILLHENSTKILSGLYQSLCKNFKRQNPLINLKIK